MKQDDTEVFLEGWIENVINWTANSNKFILRTLTHIRRVSAHNWIFTLNLPRWPDWYDWTRSAVHLLRSSFSSFPLNLILSAVEGGPLLMRQWINFCFPCGARIAVMFYGAAIQRATEMTTLVFWQDATSTASIQLLKREGPQGVPGVSNYRSLN